MRKLLLALVVGTAVWAVSPSAAQAQIGYYRNAYVTTPYYGYYGSPYTGYYYGALPGATAYSAYASPYGWRSYSSYSVVPTPLGYQSYYNTGTFARPIYGGPLHSVYWNPYSNSYMYGSGYLNPSYSWSGYFLGY
jgi:hypothetical protein